MFAILALLALAYAENYTLETSFCRELGQFQALALVPNGLANILYYKDNVSVANISTSKESTCEAMPGMPGMRGGLIYNRILLSTANASSAMAGEYHIYANVGEDYHIDFIINFSVKEPTYSDLTISAVYDYATQQEYVVCGEMTSEPSIWVIKTAIGVKEIKSYDTYLPVNELGDFEEYYCKRPDKCLKSKTNFGEMLTPETDFEHLRQAPTRVLSCQGHKELVTGISWIDYIVWLLTWF